MLHKLFVRVVNCNDGAGLQLDLNGLAIWLVITLAAAFYKFQVHGYAHQQL